jgi:hypothetical protein
MVMSVLLFIVLGGPLRAPACFAAEALRYRHQAAPDRSIHIPDVFMSAYGFEGRFCIRTI